MNPQTPRIAIWLLKQLVVNIDHNSLVGDFEEIYQSRFQNHGHVGANIWLWGQILKLVPSLLRNSIYWSIFMFANYLKIALRNLNKSKGYSFINIAGLAVGMSACILILLWVHDELGYDRFHKNADNLSLVFIEDDQYDLLWDNTSIPVAPALEQDFPEVINSARISSVVSLIVRKDKRFRERGAFVDPSFLSMFTFPFVKGEPETAFDDPFSIVITEEVSQKYFGHENPLGKVLRIDNEDDYRVAGVLHNVPRNSTIQFDFLLPMQRFIQQDRDPGNWGRFQLNTYVQLLENTTPADVEQKLASLADQHLPQENIALRLQPLARIHLFGLAGEGGRVKYIYIFSLVAIFILVIACINFMNLTTARSGNRVKEVGLRKVVGANKSDITRQFLCESVLLSLLSCVLAIALVFLLLPAFNSLSGKQISVDLFTNGQLILALIGLSLLTGILSGSYPAFFLASFRPVKMLRGTFLFSPQNKGVDKTWFRKILVVTQFSLSILLIICTAVVSSQLEFMRTKELGYNKEEILWLRMRGNLKQQYNSFKAELLQNPNVLSVTATSELPTNIAKSNSGFDWEGRTAEEDLAMNRVLVDHDFVTTLNMEMVQGRSFSKKITTDASEGYILNETAITAMALESPVGKRFSFNARDGLREGTIVGVVRDFHFQSLRNGMKPLTIYMAPDECNYICVRLRSDSPDLPGTIKFIEDKMHAVVPDLPFEYHFLDEAFDSMYRAEQQLGKIFSYATFLAILIVCLGLLGLSAFMAEQRTKEIGIRKVVGASILNIVRLLTKEFVILVSLANIIAWPIAYYAMTDWLSSFAYRQRIGIETFVLAATLALVLAFVTVGFQATRAAFANPVDSLKYE